MVWAGDGRLGFKCQVLGVRCEGPEEQVPGARFQVSGVGSQRLRAGGPVKELIVNCE